MEIGLYGPHFNSSGIRDCIIAVTDETDFRPSIFSVFLICNFVVGFPANLWEVWLIFRGNRELLALEIYVLNLAVCEILYCMGLPAQMYCFYIPEPVSEGLSLVLLVQWFLVWTARPLFQGCICVDRYITVVHPLIFLRLKPLKYRVAQCALAWSSLILTVGLLPRVPYLGMVFFFSLVSLLFYCTLSVLWSLQRPGPGDREGGDRRGGDQMKRKAFNIVLVHLLCFIANYLPAAIYRLVTEHRQAPFLVLDLIVGLGLVCGIIQPLLYLKRAGKLPCVNVAPT